MAAGQLKKPNSAVEELRRKLELRSLGQRQKLARLQSWQTFRLSFASVYPMYLAKVKKKGRTRDELHKVIQWLTDFDDQELQQLLEEKAVFETFFAKARLDPNARFIAGMICGYRKSSDREGVPGSNGSYFVEYTASARLKRVG